VKLLFLFYDTFSVGWLCYFAWHIQKLMQLAPRHIHSDVKVNTISYLLFFLFCLLVYTYLHGCLS